jgi:hypothetical protein
MPNPIRKALAATMMLSPLLGLASAVASPSLRSSASAKLAEIAQHSDRWYLYALFVTASMWLLVAAVVGLTSMVAERAPRLALLGGGLALFGALVATGDATTELMYWQMGAPGANRVQMTALADRYENAVGSSLVFAVGGLAVIAGLAILGVALWRLRLAPSWAAAGVPVGTVVNVIGFSANSNAVVIASNLVLLATLGWIGRLQFATPTAHPPQILQPHATTT